jgi:hypothetical protein
MLVQNARPPAYTPTKLNAYRRCPAEYHARFVAKQPTRVDPNLSLVRAIGAHAVIRQALDHYRQVAGYPIDLRDRVLAQLPADAYPTAVAREADVDVVLGWVHRALSSFDGTSTIRAVERTYEYLFPGSADVSAFILRSTIDLVLEHPDGTIEHIDWKTGASTWYDEIQTVVSRIVVGRAFPDRAVRSTTAYLGADTTRSELLTREQARPVWEEIKRIVRAMDGDSDWLPTSNPLCPNCPFYGTSCPLYPPAGTTDAMTVWLEELVA